VFPDLTFRFTYIENVSKIDINRAISSIMSHLLNICTNIYYVYKRMKIDDICQFSCVFGHFLRIWEIVVQVNKPSRKNCRVSFFCAKLFVMNTRHAYSRHAHTFHDLFLRRVLRSILLLCPLCMLSFSLSHLKITSIHNGWLVTGDKVSKSTWLYERFIV